MLEDRSFQMSIVSCYAKPAKKHTDKDPRWRREGIFLFSSVQSLYECRAEVIITHAPGTLDACGTHTQLVEKSIASLASWLC
jgi:hypothetical protein